MSPTVTRTLAIIGVAAFAMACSGSDTETSDIGDTSESAVAISEPSRDSQPTSTSLATETSTPETELPTTTVAVDEEAASTTSSSTSTTTTAPQDSTTSSTNDEGVVDAVAFFERQWRDCLDTLPNCDTDAIAERRGPDLVGQTQLTAADWNDRGLTAERTESLRYRVDEVAVDGNVATVDVCVTDNVRLLGPDGAVFDDRFLSSFETFVLERRSDVWWFESRSVGPDGFVEGEAESLCGS